MPKSEVLKFQPYYPAVARYGKQTLIEYYVCNPNDGKMIRRQVKVNRIIARLRTKREKQTYVADMVQTINNKLASGWNPLTQSDSAMAYKRILEVVDMFLEEKSRELRQDTMRSYASFCKMLSGYIKRTDPKMFVSSFTKTMAVRLLDDIYKTRKISQRTYNNYLKLGRTFFSWCVDKTYIQDNPFATIKLKQRTAKKRILIPREYRAKIAQYFQVVDPNFIVVLQLIYTALLRPKEIRMLKIGDIRLSERCIVVQPDVAKNHHMRFASISQGIIEGLQRMGVERYPAEYFLFGDDNKPARRPIPTSRWTKMWDKMRRIVGIPLEMQMYSLRDTGITEMIKSGIDQLSVMQQADHSSLDITTIYARHADPNLANIIYDKAPEF